MKTRTAPYKEGDRIELIRIEDDPDPIEPGSRGTVEWCEKVNFGGRGGFWQVSVVWDSGRSLMLSIPPDSIKIIGSNDGEVEAR